MTIELIDMDTGATMEVHNDKTSGLQFEGKPTERALRAQMALPYFKDLLENAIMDEMLANESNIKD